MGCGCGGSSRKPMTTTYELTTPDKERHEYLTRIEAQIARSKAGGGTVRTIRKPAT